MDFRNPCIQSYENTENISNFPKQSNISNFDKLINYYHRLTYVLNACSDVHYD